MIWTGNFLRNSSDFFRALEGYLFVNDAAVGFSRPITVVSATDTQVTLRDFGLLGEITFTGQGLALTSTNLPMNGLSFPQFTGGTISAMSVRFNSNLDDLTSALALATTTQQRTAIQAEINTVLTQTNTQLADEAGGRAPTVSHLIPNAIVVVPNISAAQLGNAAVQSFQTGTSQPMQDFLNQFSVNFNGVGAPGGLVGKGFDLVGFDNADILNGGLGNDLIAGNGGNDTLNGGGAGFDIYDGGEGSDLYILGSGLDSVSDSGTQGGIDVISYQNAPSGVQMVLAQMSTFPGMGWAEGDTFGGIEGIIGSNFDDALFGGTGALGDLFPVIVDGGAGNDTISGGNNSDTLRGGLGDDQIIGGQNQDLTGNPSSGDVAAYTAGPQDVHFFIEGNALQVITPREGVDLLTGVELISLAGQIFNLATQITLSNANRTLGGEQSGAVDGGATVDLIFGRGGNDTLKGFGQNDIINGGAGDDSLEGGSGADSISGGDNIDTILGGEGGDLIFGDQGIDVFAGTLSDLNGDTYGDLESGESIRVLNAGFDSDAVTFKNGSVIVEIDTNKDGNAETTFTIQRDFDETFGNGSGIRVIRDGDDTLLTFFGVKFADRANLPKGDAPSDLSQIRDFDGNDLGFASGWKQIGAVDIQFDGDAEYVFVNPEIGRWATVGPDGNGDINFGDHGQNGETRVVGIYIDPLVEEGIVERGSDTDSQRRFQNDLEIDNLTVVDAFDFDKDGFQEIYFKTNDGTAYLRALMHADGNIQYANYQNAQQVEDYVSDQGFDQSVLDAILM